MGAAAEEEEMSGGVAEEYSTGAEDEDPMTIGEEVGDKAVLDGT